MFEEYTQKQLRELYQKLPEKLKDALFSIKNADRIMAICRRNNVKKFREVAKLVGYVILGILPLESFQETLKKELNLSEKQAKGVSQEINRFIFYPVKEDIEEFYKIETGPSKPKEVSEKKAKAEKKDIYREPIE